MTMRPFIRRGTVRAAAIALLASLALPAQAFACWYTCTAKYGYRMTIGGESYVLQSCTQTWPEDANRPITNCVYSQE